MAELLEKPIEVADGHYLLKLKIGGSVPEPGQFINIRVGEGTDPLLRRPFSIFDWSDGISGIIIRVIGRATSLLSKAEAGTLDCNGPAGKGFSLSHGRKVLLIGGGVGTAPLLYLAKKLKEAQSHVTCIFGARSGGLIFCEDLFKKHTDHLILATDDGSKGIRGSAAEAAKKIIGREKIDMVYACGPVEMMKSVAQITGDIPLEVSVENYFGCGTGLCYGCSVETTDGMKRCCIDGPVFNGGKIIW